MRGVDAILALGLTIWSENPSPPGKWIGFAFPCPSFPFDFILKEFVKNIYIVLNQYYSHKKNHYIFFTFFFTVVVFTFSSPEAKGYGIQAFIQELLFLEK